MCMVFASAKDNENPGCFQTTMDILTKANNIPHFCVATISPPKATAFNVPLLDSNDVILQTLPCTEKVEIIDECAPSCTQ
jgi:hypothetical protein